jgi:hypothetical protein
MIFPYRGRDIGWQSDLDFVHHALAGLTPWAMGLSPFLPVLVSAIGALAQRLDGLDI